MAELILTNCKLWLAQYNLSAKMNALAIDSTPDMLDNTCFGHTGKSRKKGLNQIVANHKGFWDQESDEIIMANVGVVDVPMTFAPISGAEGEAAYSFLSQVAEYSLGGPVGELLGFTVKAESVGESLIRGNILLNGTKTSSNNGTAFQLGAIGATQKMYAALHVTAASASDTLDVKIQSDNLEAFADPTDQITFTQATDETYEWKTKDGPVTDTWWRVAWTIGGASPSFTFVVFAGIK